MAVLFDVPGFSRRVFLGTAAAAASTALLPTPAAAKTKYVRYSAFTPQGRAMLQSYRTGVEKLMSLPPSDPNHRQPSQNDERRPPRSGSGRQRDP